MPHFAVHFFSIWACFDLLKSNTSGSPNWEFAESIGVMLRSFSWPALPARGFSIRLLQFGARLPQITNKFKYEFDKLIIWVFKQKNPDRLLPNMPDFAVSFELALPWPLKNKYKWFIKLGICWSYAQIIFPASFAFQGVLNKNPTGWTDGAILPQISLITSLINS